MATNQGEAEKSAKQLDGWLSMSSCCRQRKLGSTICRSVHHHQRSVHHQQRSVYNFPFRQSVNINHWSVTCQSFHQSITWWAEANEVSEDYLKLTLFKFSLGDKAINWLRLVHVGLITTWVECRRQFLNDFFPKSNIITMRKKNLHFCARWARILLCDMGSV